MKVLLYLALSTACVLHAAHMAPFRESVKRLLAALGFALAATGYLGLAITELSTSRYDIASERRASIPITLRAWNPSTPDQPNPTPRGIVGPQRRSHRFDSHYLESSV